MKLFKRQKSSIQQNNIVPNFDIPVIPKEEIYDLSKYDDRWKYYAEYIESQTQQCSKIENSISILVIADTHNNILHKDLIQFVKDNVDEADIVAYLGDISRSSLTQFVEIVGDKKTQIGVLGNHDEMDLYENTSIISIHSNIHISGEIKIAGMEGSIKYKNLDYPAYTHQESLEIAKHIPSANILISHDVPYFSKSNIPTNHKGMIGISKYIYDNRISINIHGHTHTNDCMLLPNGCCSIGVYLSSLIKIENGTVKCYNYECKY